MPQGQRVGVLERAFPEGLADLVATLVPPFARPARSRRRVEEQRAGARMVAGTAAPAHVFEDQAGVAAQMLRHPADERIRIRLVRHERETRFRQKAPVFADEGQKAPRCIGPLVPQQAVEPQLVVFDAERGAVLDQERLFPVTREVALGPGLPKQAAAATLLAVGDQQFGETLHAGARPRRIAGEPGARRRASEPRRHPLFGQPDERLPARPVGMGFEEPGEPGERYVRFRVLQPAPLDH